MPCDNAECIKSDSKGSPLNITGGTVTLDMNGKTLSGQGRGYYGIINVGGGSLSVRGQGTVTVFYTGLTCYKGTLTVDGIIFNLTGDGNWEANGGVHNQGGFVTLNNVKMSGASEGQVYHYSGNTTINNVTTTDSQGTQYGSTYCGVYYVGDSGTLTINGGTFDKIVVNSGNYGGVQSVAGLLGQGYTYKKQESIWATADEMAGWEISNVTVEKIPLTINPNGDTSWYYSTQQTHTLAMNAAPVDSSDSVTYVWKSGTKTLDCTSDAYTVPADTPVGSYTYTCEATCDDYTLSHTFTFKIEKSGTEFTGGIKTYNGSEETPGFSADDTITVKAAPTATGTIPQKAAARLRSDYTAPVAGEMALFVGDVQVSEPVVAGVDGIYTMTVSASDVLTLGGVEPNGDPITLTAKFVGNDNMADAEGTVDVNISAVARVEKGSTTTYVGALVDAFTDGNSGATVTLLSEVDLGSNYIRISGSNTFTLDLNGQTVKATDYGAFVIPGGSLTIQDSGTGGKIESSNIAIKVTGGTLSIKSGTVSGHTGVQISGGTVNISGGTVSGNDIGLWVSGGGSITLSGGTFSGVVGVEVHNDASATLKDLLAAGCAYHQNDIPVANATGWLDSGDSGDVPLDAKSAWLTGPVTVKECNHTGGLTPSGNGYQHGGDCLCCGANLPLEEHTLGTDGKCTACGAELVAQVNDTCYTDFQSAWSAAQRAGTAIVTLLTDVTLPDEKYVAVAGQQNITLKSPDGKKFTLSGNYNRVIYVLGGSLNVEDVTVENTNTQYRDNSAIYVGNITGSKQITIGKGATVTGYTGIFQSCSDSTLTVYGTVEGMTEGGRGILYDKGTLTVEEGAKISGGDYGCGIDQQGGSLIINGGAISGGDGVSIANADSARLNGGTFTGTGTGADYNAISAKANYDNPLPLGDLLEIGYAIFKADGTAVERTVTSTGPGTFTVKECRHTGVGAADQGGGKHGLTCPYCGYSCSHDTILTATTSDTVITVNKGCETEGCGYSEKLGTVSFTFENLVYRDSEAMVSWTKDGPAASGVMLKIDNADDYAIQSEDTAYSCSLTDLFGSTPVTAGDYTLKVLFYDDSIIGGKYVECELPFIVAPATLTENMVTLDKMEVTYNGAEQKPTLTVRHGQTVLTERTDYEVSYSRDGVAATDFTNAGVVAVTVTGKGNYGGTVIKEFTISKADVPETALTSTAPADLVYTGQPKTAAVAADNLSGLGEITIKYKKDDKGDFLTEAVEPGAYSVYAVISEGENYNIAEIGMGQFTISYMEAPVLQYNGSDKKEYYNRDVAVAAVPAGGHTYTVSDAIDGEYKESFTIPAQQGAVTKTLYFKDEAGHISGGEPVILSFDLTPPTGKIAAGAKWWQNVLHFVSFGNYAPKEYTVSINAEDVGGSGIDKIEYAIVTGDSQYTDADALAAANLSWTAYNDSSRPTVPADSSPYVVYARLTDKVGNVAYISTDGVLLDSTAPTVGDLTVPEETIKDVTAGVTFTVDEAADYYYVVLSKDSAAPDPEDIIVTCGGTLPEGRTGTAIAGTVPKGSGAVSGDTPTVSVEVNNLQPNTAYIVYVTAVDRALDITNSGDGTPAGNIAAVKASAEFTTKKTIPVITKAPAVTGTYGQSAGEMTVAGGAAQDGNTVLTGTWTVSGPDKDKKPFAGTAEKVTVIFTPDSDKYDIVSVQAALEVGQAEPDVGAVTANVLENTLDVKKVVLSRTNKTPAGTLTLTDSALEYGTNTYTWEFVPDDKVNYKTVTGEVQITVKDTIPPAAEYRTGTDGWKKFVDTVSFGLFCKDHETVTIRGTDDTETVRGSGISRIQYFISDKEITDTGSIVWNTYTEPLGLDAQGTYLIYVKVTDNAGNTAVLNSEGIVVYAESTVSPAASDYTYKENRDCTVQLDMNGNTFKELTDQEGNAIDTTNYSIDSDGKLILKAAYLDTLDKGEYTYTVSVNPQGIETDQVILEYTFTVNVKAKELTVSGAAAAGRAYDGTNAVEITAVALSGAAPEDEVTVNLSGIKGTLDSANAGTYTAVTLPELTLTGKDSGNYTLVQPETAVPTSVKITPLDAVITVGTAAYDKTFGDAAFTLDVTDSNTEADVQYEVTKGTDVVSVENGTVTIQSAGTAEIKVSLPASTNYTAAEDKYIRITVNKKSGYTVAALNRSYYYQDGGTDSIDLALLLPADCGSVAYGEAAVSGDMTYRAAPAVSGGKLSYTLSSGELDDTGTITVTAETQNYEDITITINVKLTDQIPVSLKDGTEVTLKNHVLIYGEQLSKLVFNEAEFVGTDGKTVTGTLMWKEAAATPDAGTVSAVWIFIPAEDKYASLEGTAAITVNRAEPTVSAVPAVEGRVYNPSVTLKDSKLSGGIVTGVDGKELEGGWSWQSADIVPTVTSGGYVAVFTPEDTINYKTVDRTIAVNVTKAVPYIAELPAAAGITYGETLKDSALSGGTVQYGNGTGQAGDSDGSSAVVAGTFTWKEPATKPVVADSNVTEYTVIFTPSDTANYDPVETKVKLTVNKAQNDPNMPDTGIPFIKDEDGKIGWDVIRAEEEQAKEGSVINVDMNGTSVVPGDIFDSIKGRDITITFDMGGGILWSVDGKSIITDKAGDIDFSVKTGGNSIPVDIVNNVTGERYSIQLSLSYEGEFGFTAVLSIGLGRGNAGYTASLYYYKESTGKLEFICADEVAEDGTVSLAFTHASDYVIVIDERKEEQTGTGETAQPQLPAATVESTVDIPESPKTGQEKKNVLWPIVAGIIALAGTVFGGVLAWKKKEEKG